MPPRRAAQARAEGREVRRAIREANYKLIRDANGILADQLYHLGNDPFEQNDLFLPYSVNPDFSDTYGWL